MGDQMQHFSKKEQRMARNPNPGELLKLSGIYWQTCTLHAASPNGCKVIIEKAQSALLPGGMIIIHDFILNNAKDAPLFPTLFSLNMLLVTGGGQAYSEQKITKMLSQSSFTGIQRLSFVGPNDSGLITGILPQ